MLRKYRKYYSDQQLAEKLKKVAGKTGRKVVHQVLLLYYVMKDKKTGIKTKIGIAAALGYFILPADAIFDLTPVIGFSDDVAILAITILRVAKNITPEIKAKAQRKMKEWFQKSNSTISET